VDEVQEASEARRREDAGWRPAVLAGGVALAEGAAEDWQEVMREAHTAYCQNPLAYAVIEQQTNFVLGGGVQVVAADRRVQQVVDAFWRDPENEMDRRVYAIQTELALFGEQFIRYFVDGLTGRVVIRQLDPLAVVAIKTDPDDVEKALAYLYRPAGPAGRAGELASGGAAAGEWLPAAEVAHFAINKTSNTLRGRSDLAPVLRWLRRYSEWLNDRVRQNRLKGAFVYDVAVTGADNAYLQRMRAEYGQAPAPGTVLFHNEKEVWQAIQPQIGAADVRDDGRALRLMIAAGAGVPEHYLGEGGNVNRATAAEMGLPAIKRMQRRQETLRHVVATLCGRVVTEAVRAGRLGPRVRRELAVHFEELSPAGIDQEATAAKTLAEALALAEERGWADKEQARRVWWRFAGDPEEAKRVVDGERAEGRREGAGAAVGK
jgi:hypothetical protein